MLDEIEIFENNRQNCNTIKIASVAIAEDQSIFRAALCAMLAKEPDFQVVAEASNDRDAISMVGKHTPDILLMDLSMPNFTHTKAIKTIKQQYPATKIVVLTTHKAEEYIRAALRAGADAYVLKSDEQSELFSAMHHILEGKSYISPNIRDHIVSGYGDNPSSEKPSLQSWSKLTQREREVMTLIVKGYRNKGIAENLGISPKTVEKHRANLMKKLDLHSATAVTAFAIENGLH